MTNGSNNRLDRIDSDLENVKDILVAVARRAEATDERLNLLIESQDRTQQQLDQLSIKVDRLTEDVDIAFQTINLMSENWDRDRSEAQKNAEQDRAEFRAETLRIWAYLMGQQRNGRDGPQS